MTCSSHPSLTNCFRTSELQNFKVDVAFFHSLSLTHSLSLSLSPSLSLSLSPSLSFICLRLSPTLFFLSIDLPIFFYLCSLIIFNICFLFPFLCLFLIFLDPKAICLWSLSKSLFVFLLFPLVSPFSVPLFLSFDFSPHFLFLYLN